MRKSQNNSVTADVRSANRIMNIYKNKKSFQEQSVILNVSVFYKHNASSKERYHMVMSHF